MAVYDVSSHVLRNVEKLLAVQRKMSPYQAFCKPCHAVCVFVVVFGRWVSQYLPEKEGHDLQQLLGNQEHIIVESRQYDWLLNKL